MMNIYERLKQDHHKQRELARKIMGTQGDSKERRELWAKFKPEAEAHAAAEEQTFYAALIEKPDGQEKARHSISEHNEAHELIKELNNMEMSGSGWIQKFEKLKEDMEHHMDEEENEVFGRARKLLDDRTAQQLADNFETRKKAELSS